MNAALPKNNVDNKLLFVHDAKTQKKWLIDGGAVMSIIPPTLAQRLQGPTSTQLQAANGSKIPCYGMRNMHINLADRSILFPITIADVKQPILGADFLAHSYLAPNHRDGTLIDLRNFSVLKADIDHESKPIRINLVEHASDPYYQLLDEFPSLSVPTFKIKTVDHGVRHYIPTNGPPVQSRARKLPPDKLAVAKAELDKLVELGVCERGKSEWSSPLLVTTKPCNSPCTCKDNHPCGGWRVCGDYRRLNDMTTDDRYPVRNLQDFNSELRGMKIFSKVDLLKGYHQIPVNDEDIKKTAVITPFGLYLFPRCPFGLKNAGQDFQRLMDEILGDIPHIFVYLDDILIASPNKKQHLEDLRTVFSILEQNGLTVNRKKCVFGKSQLDFLGHFVDADGIRPQIEKVEAILATKPPTTVKELRRFLGAINYYRRFVKAAAAHLFHLFCALKANPKKLDWSPDMQASFEKIKEVLAQRTMLHHPDASLPLALTTDASQYAIGGVLEQRGPQGWEPLGFFSKKLNDSQQDWCPYDRELQAVHASVRHFKHMLEGRPFTIYTDHQSLVPSMSKKTDAPTARQRNQLAEISEYTTDIRYLEGKANVVADALSRPNGEGPSNTNSIDIPEIHIFQINMIELGLMPSNDAYVNHVTKMQAKGSQQVNSVQSDDDDDFEARYQKLKSVKTVSFSDSETPAKPHPPAALSTKTAAAPILKKPAKVDIAEETADEPKLSSKHIFQEMLDSCKSIPPPDHPPKPDPFPSLIREMEKKEAAKQMATITPPLPLSNSSKELPSQKLEDLQIVVNSIDHYNIDLEDMARQQALDPEFRQISRDARTGLNFKKVKIGESDLFVDVSNGPARPFVPTAYRKRIFEVIHGLGHPGVKRTCQAVAAKFVWPNLQANVSTWSRQCLDCQRAKVNRHTTPTIGSFTQPTKRFAHLHADLVSMPPSNGYNHLLTIVDRFSRWSAAIPLKDINADTIIDALTHNWIAAHGVPEIITTDRGSQFTSSLWTQLMRTWGTKHVKTTAYHPESNGMVERLHRRLKESLKALLNDQQTRWFWRLPMTLLALRTTVKADLGASPADLVYGDALTVPGQLIPAHPTDDQELLQQQRRSLNNLRMEVERLQPTPASTHRSPAIHVPDELATCTHVFIQRGGVQPGMSTPFDGPYRVISKHNNGFRIQFPGRPSDIIALSRLKPAFMAAEQQDDNNGNSQDLDDEVPPSPPPPGRRPGIRTRQPDATDRVTRSQRQQHDGQQPSTSGHEPFLRARQTSRETPAAATDSQPPRRRQQPQSDDDAYVPVPFDPNYVDIPQDPNLAAGPSRAENFLMMQEEAAAAATAPETPAQVDRPVEPECSEGRSSPCGNNRGGAEPPRKQRVYSFSNPKKGNFSYRRKRPDVSALNAIIHAHLSQ